MPNQNIKLNPTYCTIADEVEFVVDLRSGL